MFIGVKEKLQVMGIREFYYFPFLMCPNCITQPGASSLFVFYS